MKPEIHDSIEAPRECGDRVPGGTYVMGGSVSKECCIFPIRLENCAHCGAGIKFSRGWTWLSVSALKFEKTSACLPFNDASRICSPFDDSSRKIGLLWIGKKTYSVSSFLKEAAARGVSRRIATVPRDLRIGDTWVALAIQSNFSLPSVIFSAFRVSGVDYIVKGGESDAELQRKVDSGIRLVNVILRDVVEVGLFEKQNKNL